MSKPDHTGQPLPVVLARLAGLPAGQAADEARADQDARWRAGECPAVEAYLAGLPGVAADPEQALVLIYGEVLARAAQGDAPAEGEYRRRFPHLADRIAVQFAVHAVLAAEPSEPTGAYLPAPPVRSAERFPPGALLAGRFRVVGLLGRGGMGEVYRADDTALGQSVALKFLPGELAADPDRLARFRNEVAAARRVSHPNVCRVYDIAFHDAGRPPLLPFLTMEYIDGEDLASLLKRVGRLPEEKGVEVARQLCAALGAVHDQGLLHRDLKPANVMVDGRGQVRLADFGLAAAAEGLSGTEVRSGTPLYQAPEQLAGREVTVRSDLYALGLVLYELFTGRRAFTGKERDAPPSRPSSHVTGLSPAVESVILRCLESDPASRPASAARVLAALPGGDPLAAVLAAGETPSPQLVADGGEVGALSPAVGMGLLVATGLLLVVIAVLNDWTTLFRRVPLTKTPADLTVRARALLDELAGPPAPVDSACGFVPDTAFLWTVRSGDNFPGWWHDVYKGQPAALHFFYRQAPSPLLVADLTVPQYRYISPESPRPVSPGMAGVRLDGSGRLLELYSVPPTREASGEATGPPDWGALFHAAGLNRADFREVEPLRVPPYFADARGAWVGPYPDNPGVTARVEAAAYRGRTVWFRLTPEGVTVEAEGKAPGVPTPAALMTVAAVGLSGLLAIRNIRRGRGDLRGAGRVCAFVVGVTALAWVVGGHHVPSLGGEVRQLAPLFWEGGLITATTALFYLAVEPAVRRRWPGRMTAWARALDGRLRDPLVGRDLLVGALAGAVLVVVEKLPVLALVTLGPSAPPAFRLVHPLQPPILLEVVLGMPALGAVNALTAFTVAFLVSLALRRGWLAWPAFVLLAVVASLPSVGGSTVNVVTDAVGLTVYWSVVAVVVARFGLLANACTATVAITLPLVTLTYDTSAWYFAGGLVWALVVLALAGYGYFTATRGGRLFGEGFFGDE